ncbi:MAG TPA: hypothetical protein VIO94_09835 [Phenylobacterium sp.]
MALADQPAADLHPARPFAVLALAAFLLGFIGYLLLSMPLVAKAYAEPTASPARVSGPVSADWNIERRV